MKYEEEIMLLEKMLRQLENEILFHSIQKGVKDFYVIQDCFVDLDEELAYLEERLLNPMVHIQRAQVKPVE